MDLYNNSRYGFTKICPDSMCKDSKQFEKYKGATGSMGRWIHSDFCECDILLSETPTVDGRNPAPVEVGSLSHDFQCFIHPRWHQQYGKKIDLHPRSLT